MFAEDTARKSLFQGTRIHFRERDTSPPLLAAGCAEVTRNQSLGL